MCLHVYSIRFAPDPVHRTPVRVRRFVSDCLFYCVVVSEAVREVIDGWDSCVSRTATGAVDVFSELLLRVRNAVFDYKKIGLDLNEHDREFSRRVERLRDFCGWATWLRCKITPKGRAHKKFWDEWRRKREETQAMNWHEAQ